MKYYCIKQHDITDCGAACLATVSKQYGLSTSITKIREIAGTDELMQYDTHEETVQVIVDLDNEGLISARAAYDADGAVFVNEKLDQLPDPPLEPDDPPSRPRNRSERTTTYTTGFPPGQSPERYIRA